MSATSELGPLDVQVSEHQEGDVDAYKSALNGFNALEQIQAHALENLDSAVQLILSRIRGRMKFQDIIKLAIEFSSSTSGCLYSQIQPKTITENARALDVGKQYGVRILTRYMGWTEEKAMPVIHRLVYEYPSHSFIIDREEVVELGLKVEFPSERTESILEDLGLALDVRQASDQEIEFYANNTIANQRVRKSKNGNRRK